MFRAEVATPCNTGPYVTITHKNGLTFSIHMSLGLCEQLASQINAGADVEAKVQEAVRMEREAVVKWLRHQAIGKPRTGGGYDYAANGIERGDHTKGC